MGGQQTRKSHRVQLNFLPIFNWPYFSIIFVSFVTHLLASLIYCQWNGQLLRLDKDESENEPEKTGLKGTEHDYC